MITMLVHLTFDTATIYTVNHLDTVPQWLNDLVHRVFIGSMVLVMYLFYQYVDVLTEKKSTKRRYLNRFAKILFLIMQLGVLILPIYYVVTDQGIYLDGFLRNIC